MVSSDPFSIQHYRSDHHLVTRALQVECGNDHTTTLCAQTHVLRVCGAPLVFPVRHFVGCGVQLQGATLCHVVAARPRLRTIYIAKFLLKLVELNPTI